MTYTLEDDPKFQRWVDYLIDDLKDMYKDLMVEVCCDEDDAYTILHPGSKPECPAYRALIDGAVKDDLGIDGEVNIIGVEYLSKEAALEIERKVNEGRPLNQILGDNTMNRIYKEVVPYILQLVKCEVTHIYQSMVKVAEKAGISMYDKTALIKYFKTADNEYGKYDYDVYAMYLQDEIVDAAYENILS